MIPSGLCALSEIKAGGGISINLKGLMQKFVHTHEAPCGTISNLHLPIYSDVSDMSLEGRYITGCPCTVEVPRGDAGNMEAKLT